MRARGGSARFVTAAIVAVLITSSLGTAWTVRSTSFHSNVDPSLRAGEVALVHTTAGRAGALSLNLIRLGAIDVETESAADTVIARLSADALAAIAQDPTVTVAARDTRIVALDGSSGRSGWDDERSSDRLEGPRGPFSIGRARGENVTVAVMDTGVAEHPDLRGKVRARANFVPDGNSAFDAGGHGTFIAGVIAADGEYKGVAPDATLVSLRVLDANGSGTAAGVVRAFDWLLIHRTALAIKVLNISWGAPQATSYDNDLLSALAESAWFAGITVVASAGNSGPAARTISSPGSDPFIITAGAYDDMGSARTSDDVAASFSSLGPTLDGFTKPDTLAPGVHVLGLRVRGVTYLGPSGLPVGSPTDRYIHMTGTSASAAYVSGVAALVASAHPTYTPTQIKGAIVASGRAVADSTTKAVDASTALTVRPAAANAGLRPSALLLALLAQKHMLIVNGATWEGATWEGTTWETVSWETVSWEAVSWETVTWEGVTWERLLQ